TMKRFLTGGIAFVLALTFVVSGSLVAQEEANKKLLKIELPSLKIRKPACCDTDAEKAQCEKCSSKKTPLAALKSISLKHACEDCTRKEKCAKCAAAAADKPAVVKESITATTEKAKKAVGKLRDRVKDAVKRDKAEK
ncbi:MAG: hypothetical protein NZ744_15755, partial [Pirellulaceae bacterium]|nr:hypothetical protein [Pirellulaceae bacterium]